MEQIFVSSVQREFAEERRAIRDFLEGDALLRRFFSVFLFEDLPARDRRADPHRLQRAEKVIAIFGLAGRRPFQQPSARDQQSPGGARKSIQRDARFIGQAGERESGLGEMPPSRAPRPGDPLQAPPNGTASAAAP